MEYILSQIEGYQGDQPNNAFSLNVFNVGEIAATGGTSAVKALSTRS